MKKLLHTPGHWHVEKLGPLTDQLTFRIFSEGREPEVICDLYGGPGIVKDDSETKANAQLIAAAPEMLQVLMGFVKQMEAGLFPNLAHAKAIEVIKKAVGDE